MQKMEDCYLEYVFDDISEQIESYFKPYSSYSESFGMYLESLGINCQGDKYYTKRYNLNSYFFCYTLEGSGIMLYNNRTYKLVPNSLCFIYCNEYQHYYTVSGERWKFLWIHFRGSECSKFFDIIFKNGFDIFYPVDQNRIFFIYKSIIQALQNNIDINNLKIYKLLNDLLCYMCEISLDKSNSYLKQPQWVMTTTKYIFDHFNEDISVTYLALLSNYSKTHFIRLFKKYTGLSPYDYILNYRMSYAKHLLKTTAYTLEEICEKVHFSNPSRFISKFKEQTLQTPTEFRKSR